METQDTQNTAPVVEDEEIEVSPFDPQASEKLAPLEVPEEPLPSEKEDVLDIIQPRSEPKLWVFKSEKYGDREYVQEELAFLRKMEWGALLGDVLDKAMSGPNPLNLSSLFSAPQFGGPAGLDASSFREAEVFVQAVGKLVAHAPKFLEKSYAIWLNVPELDREVFWDIINSTPAKGGLNDDQGFEIMERFIDQNWAAIEQIFTERVGKLRKRVEAKRAK